MKTGIYGGTFNPIHLGHMQAAAFAAKELELEQLVLIPAGIPPHKAMAQDSPDNCHRLAMARLAAERLQLELGIPVVVSDMEMEIALRSGVSPHKIIWNGPIKNAEKVARLLLDGGTVNIDSVFELDFLRLLADSNPDTTLNIGIRCNFDVF